MTMEKNEAPDRIWLEEHAGDLHAFRYKQSNESVEYSRVSVDGVAPTVDDDAFHCEHCEHAFTEKPHATDDGYWLCDPCWEGLRAERPVLTTLRQAARMALQQFEFTYGKRKRGWDAKFLMDRLKAAIAGSEVPGSLATAASTVATVEQPEAEVDYFDAVSLLEKAMRTSMEIGCDCPRTSGACDGECVGSRIWQLIHRARKLIKSAASPNVQASSVETGQCDACSATVPVDELVHYNENNTSGVEGTFCNACRRSA